MEHLKGERLEQRGRGCVQRRSWPCAVKIAHLRKRILKDGKNEKKTCFFEGEGDASRAVLWAADPAPQARVRFRRRFNEKEIYWGDTWTDGATATAAPLKLYREGELAT